LSGIFKTALSDGVVNANPASALFVPDCRKPESDRRTMTVDQIRLALSVLDLREQLIFKLAAYGGQIALADQMDELRPKRRGLN